MKILHWIRYAATNTAHSSSVHKRSGSKTMLDPRTLLIKIYINDFINAYHHHETIIKMRSSVECSFFSRPVQILFYTFTEVWVFSAALNYEWNVHFDLMVLRTNPCSGPGPYRTRYLALTSCRLRSMCNLLENGNGTKYQLTVVYRQNSKIFCKSLSWTCIYFAATPSASTVG